MEAGGANVAFQTLRREKMQLGSEDTIFGVSDPVTFQFSSAAGPVVPARPARALVRRRPYQRGEGQWRGHQSIRIYAFFF